jgi:hypothetical protein
MNQKTVKFIEYLISLIFILFTTSALSNDTNHYIAYNNLLFDRDGTVIIDDSEHVKSIKYQDHYWIVQLTNYHDKNIYNNIKKIDNYKFAFEKQGDILKFKTTKTLTYLGEERMAYHYQDTALFVIIDTDGKLITPKGRYYRKISPFINGYAEVTTSEYEEGYLNLQGRFFKKHPKPIQTQSTITPKPSCSIITSDTIMQLCKKNNSFYLVNTKTGKETNVGPRAWNTNFGSDGYKNNLSTGYFWLGNYQDKYKVYQIYDYNGKMHYQNQYDNVSKLYGAASWVKDNYNAKKVRLIDVTGKTIGEFDNYSLVKIGAEKRYYAQKSAPHNKNEKEEENQNKEMLLSIFDSNGNILLYEDIIGPEQNSNCYRNVKVLKNAKKQIVWPTNLDRECLLDRYIQSAKTDNYRYQNKEQKSEEITIP